MASAEAIVVSTTNELPNLLGPHSIPLVAATHRLLANPIGIAACRYSAR